MVVCVCVCVCGPWLLFIFDEELNNASSSDPVKPLKLTHSQGHRFPPTWCVCVTTDMNCRMERLCVFDSEGDEK